MRALKHGEVGVSFFSTTTDLPQREILPESRLILLDRMYQPGDLLKRSIDDVRSGVVTRFVKLSIQADYTTRSFIELYSIDVQGRLEHAISYEPISEWKSMDDVECYIDVDMGDYVVYDDWVGQVSGYIPSVRSFLTLVRLSRYAVICRSCVHCF